MGGHINCASDNNNFIGEITKPLANFFLEFFLLVILLKQVKASNWLLMVLLINPQVGLWEWHNPQKDSLYSLLTTRRGLPFLL